MNKRLEFEPSSYGISAMSARNVLGENIKALMDASRDCRSTVALEKATALKGSKVGKSTIDRAIKGETNLTIDNIEVIAKVFGLDPWQLMTPGLRPSSPPVLRSIGETEDALYKRIGELAKEIAELQRD